MAPNNAACHCAQAVEHEKQKDLAEVERRIQKHISNAKGSMGVWSEHGIFETRRLFWDAYENGKARHTLPLLR